MKEIVRTGKRKTKLVKFRRSIRRSQQATVPRSSEAYPGSPLRKTLQNYRPFNQIIEQTTIVKKLHRKLTTVHIDLHFLTNKENKNTFDWFSEQNKQVFALLASLTNYGKNFHNRYVCVVYDITTLQKFSLSEEGENISILYIVRDYTIH